MKQILRTTIILSMLILFGFGCKGLSKTEQAAIRPVSLDYWTVYEDVTMLQQLAAEYRQTRPYVSINIRRVRADDFEELLLNALADDVPPDIISISSREFLKYQNRIAPMPSSVNVANVYSTGGLSNETVVEPVTVRMPALSTLERSYVPAAVESMIFGNDVYGFPLSVDTLALYYNTEMLDKAGIPEPPTDWAEFAEAVKDVTRFDSAGNIIQSGVAMGTNNNIPNSFDLFSLLLMQNGVDLETYGVDAIDAGISERNLDVHPTMQSLRFFTDFVRPEKDLYTWNSSQVSARDSFIRGASAFYFGFAHEKDLITAQAPALSFDIIPVPQLDPTDPQNVAQVALQSVVAKSTDQNEAWDFLRYVALEQNIERYVSANNIPTPLRALVTDQSEIPEMAPFMESILTASNWYVGREYIQAKEAFATLFTAYVAPYGTEEEPAERDVRLIDTLVRTLDQTY